MDKKIKMTVDSLSRKETKKNKKIRETKQRQAAGLFLLDARMKING